MSEQEKAQGGQEKPRGDRPAIAFINGRFTHRGTLYKETAGEEVVTTEFGLDVFGEGPLAVVKRSYGVTINMGGYESARVDVGIELPCHPTDIVEADEFAAQWVERRVKFEIASLQEDKNVSDY